MRFLLPLASLGVLLAFPAGSAAQALGAVPAMSASSQVSSLGTPTAVGTENIEGHRVDGDGDLMVVADDTCVRVVNTATNSVEALDLLALASPQPTGVTGVLDVAVHDDLVVVLVERSGGTVGPVLLAFRRTLPMGTPTWVASGQREPIEEFMGPGPLVQSQALCELRDETVVLALSPEFVGFPPQQLWVMTLDASTPGTLSLLTNQFQDFRAVESLALGRPSQAGWSPLEFRVALGWSDGANGGASLFTVVTGSGGLVPNGTLTAQQAPGTRFGAAVAVDGWRVYVGEPGADVGGTDTGRVVVFDSALQSTPIQVIANGAPTNGDEFGRALALDASGSTLAIAELQSDAIPAASDTGYVRTATVRSNGTLELRHDTLGFAGSVSGSGEFFGADLSFGANEQLYAVAPAPGPAGGYAAWFALPEMPWMEVVQLTALAGTGGVEPKLVLEGGIYTDGPLVVGVREAAAFSTTFLVLGLTELSAPAKGGIVYPAPDVLIGLSTNAQGELVLPTVWSASSVALGPFDTFLQFWTVDAGGPQGFSASHGGIVHQY